MSNATLVHETANAPGTNVTFNLAGNVPGRRGFAMAFPAGGTPHTVITDGVQSEWGLYDFTPGSPNQISRTTVLGNSANTTARLNFTGTVDVYCTLPAEEILILSDGPLAGFRNLIINGNPTINQRGYVSGAATTGANQYTLDRWRVVTSGQSVSWTDSGGVRAVSAPPGGMEQVIEGANILAGVYTLSWQGSGTATVNGAPVANGGQVTLPGGTDATVRMTGGPWSLLQLEPGPKKTPFEQRPRAAEQALCDRYARVVTTGASFGASGGGAFSGSGVNWDEMRAAPTSTLITNITNLNTTTSAISFLTTTGGLFAAIAAGAGATTIVQNWFLDAEI